MYANTTLGFGSLYKIPEQNPITAIDNVTPSKTKNMIQNA
jgi:hypothetical protein